VIKMVNMFLESLRQKHDVREAYLFGSFARGMAEDYSDVDLAVVLGSLEKPHGLFLNCQPKNVVRSKYHF